MGRVGSNLVSALSMFKLAQLFFQGTNHVCFRLHGTMWLTIQIIRISTVKAVQKLAKCSFVTCSLEVGVVTREFLVVTATPHLEGKVTGELCQFLHCFQSDASDFLLIKCSPS